MNARAVAAAGQGGKSPYAAVLRYYSIHAATHSRLGDGGRRRGSASLAPSCIGCECFSRVLIAKSQRLCFVCKSPLALIEYRRLYCLCDRCHIAGRKGENPMDTSDMKVFSLLCECKNVSRAAESLFMSQQGVSNLLQRLEKELGVELFKRTRNGLELTKYGEVVQKHVETILTEYSAMQNSLEKIRKENHRLFVTMELGILAILTSKPFLDFKSNHPDIEFIMQEHTPKTNERLLMEEAADICLALAPYPSDLFDIMPFYQVSGAVLMDKSNELAGRSAIYVEDLKNRPLLAFGSATYYPYLRACRKAGFEPNMTVSGIELQDPRPYVRGTDGLCPSFYGILPDITEEDGLVVVPFRTDLLWSICAITTKGRKLSALSKEFMEALVHFVNTAKII